LKNSAAPKKEKYDIESCLPRSKSKYIPPHKRKPSQRFVPTCHHCGKVDHIQPKCFDLKSHKHKSENSYSRKESKGLLIMMREVLSRLDKFEQNHKSRPKISQVWVKKDDTTHPLRSGDDLILC
jgi:hypothetical protein